MNRHLNDVHFCRKLPLLTPEQLAGEFRAVRRERDTNPKLSAEAYSRKLDVILATGLMLHGWVFRKALGTVAPDAL